jgi:hypothetical protein
MLSYWAGIQGTIGYKSTTEDGATEKMPSTLEERRPRGFLPIGVFFVFGATMAAYAAVTLWFPGTFLDFLWALNPEAYARLDDSAALPFLLLSVFLGLVAVGWFRRRLWGWALGVAVIGFHILVDLGQMAFGEERWKGVVGIGIALLLLLYMTQPGVRKHFRRSTYIRDLWRLCFSMPGSMALREPMKPELEDNSSQAPCLRCGVVVTVIAVILGCGPFVGKIYLRSTVPRIDVNLPKWSDSQSMGTTDFLKHQLNEAYEQALSLGGQLDDSHHSKAAKQLASYRQAVTILNLLHSKLETSLEATAREKCGWQFPLLKGRVEARETGERRAQHLNNRMMAVVTLIAAVFLFFVLRSPRIPDWSKKVSMMTAGAILAGWLPL